MNEDISKALSLCKGRYQRDLVLGRAAFSGADLQGKAKQWSRYYKRSRDNLLSRMDENGVFYVVTKGKHNKLSLIIGEREFFLDKFTRMCSKSNPELCALLEHATRKNYRYKTVRALAELAYEHAIASS